MTGWLVNLDSKHKVILFGAGLLTAIVLVYLGIIAPQGKRMDVLAAQCQIEQQRIKTIESYAQKYPDPSQHVRDMDAKVAKLAAKLPDKPEIGGFLKEIEQAAKLSQVSLLEIKPLAMVNRNGYREIPIEIQLKASFPNLLEFTKKMGELQRFNYLTYAHLQAKQGILEVKLIAVVYSYGIFSEPVPQQPSQSSPVKNKKN